ncbi:uncharacterized protein LOC122456618 [Dermochelys coriacea]|uniref:uncharacterized protein LOC122456618 n=1 Tax=Dermochelys coriacea TaxID=27794 RepID=UPI001CA8A748|nr:uncharacterized protein LOC122456618 [Dermochelys coriacea]
MPTTIMAAPSNTACDPILVFRSKGKRNYYNSTYQGRITLSDWLLVSVKNASEWMAGEYQVVSDLHETCMARINLTVPGPVLFPPPISETPTVREGTANQTREGSRRGLLSNGSLEGEPRGRCGMWVSPGFVAAFIAAALYVRWKRGREGPETHRGCEEEGIMDSADSPVCVLARVSHLHKAGTQDIEAGEEIPLNGEVATEPRELSWLPPHSREAAL